MSDVLGWVTTIGIGAAAIAGGLAWWPRMTLDRPRSHWWGEAATATVAVTFGAAALLV